MAALFLPVLLCVIFTATAYSEIYFEETNGIGIIGLNYTMKCIVKGMVGLTDIVITHGDDQEDIKSTKGVYIVRYEINEIIANMTIEKTIKCGDDGIYYCKTRGASLEAQAEASLTVQWTSGNPTIDLSVDIVEDSYPWDGFETLCSAEIGSNDASIFFQTNKNGKFENVSDTNTPHYPVIKSDPSMCSNVKTIAFVNQYTAAWNKTTFRCVVQDADSRKMDSAIIYVVPESICDNQQFYTTVPHPFDCRARFTCTDVAKKLMPYKYCSVTDECYDYETYSCVDCEDVGKCREVPLEIEPYMECTATVGTIERIASIVCTLYHITLDGVSFYITVIRNGEILIEAQYPPETSQNNDGHTDTPSLLLKPSAIKVDFNPVRCEDKGKYVIRVVKGAIEIDATTHLYVQSPASTPTLTKSVSQYRHWVQATISCTGSVGKPQGFLILTFRSTPSGNFESVPDSTDASYIDSNNQCTFIGELSYTFNVDEAQEGTEFRCKSVEYFSQEEFVSNIETVNFANTDGCYLTTCQNGGSCVDRKTCHCRDGFKGQQCQIVLWEPAMLIVIVAASVLLIVIVVIICCFCLRHRRNKAKRQESNSGESNNTEHIQSDVTEMISYTTCPPESVRSFGTAIYTQGRIVDNQNEDDNGHIILQTDQRSGNMMYTYDYLTPVHTAASGNTEANGSETVGCSANAERSYGYDNARPLSPDSFQY